MNMNISELIPYASVLIAFAGLYLALHKERNINVSDTQAIRDKLDYISDTTRDTREDVRALDRKLDDHATRITKIETELEDHDRRIERLES